MKRLLIALPLLACTTSGGEGLAPSKPAKTTVALDYFNRPLPKIPLPNDVATRYDPTSATKRRINASMVAPTKLEVRVRQLIDQLDGWGVFQQISIPFTGPVDLHSIWNAHRKDKNYASADDVIYLFNVDRDSPKFGELIHLDMGHGNYPVLLERTEYWDNDPRGWTNSLSTEEADEDLNGDGKLQWEEDTDADGVLDVPNYLPREIVEATPGLRWPTSREDYGARADALMTFWERETNTLITRPMIPLDERTTYAVVVTRRLLDADGQPVGSPSSYVNDASQTRALEGLPEVLGKHSLSLDDVAYTFSFTTQTIESNWIAVREGLYGHGVQKHLGEEYPAEVSQLESIRDRANFPNMKNPYVMYTENWMPKFKQVYEDVFEADTDGFQFAALEEAHRYIDYHVVGSFESPQLFRRADPSGKWLPYHDQVWPEDLDSKPAKTRPETVYFWLTVPRKEISVRKDGKPAPIVILGHGYSSSRIELLPFAGFFAKHGLATISIDCVSHGVGVSELVIAAAERIFDSAGLKPFVSAALKDRAKDQNGDLTRDSGADFWTAYLFHTRDVVRQSALDYMQLIRIIDTFDGTKTWKFDVNADGRPDLAGDFDGDGVLDIGRGSTKGITGGSLGGIMSLVVGGIEPKIDMSVPIAGGGGLSDIGVRSQQGGVREAVALRMLAPVYMGAAVWNNDTMALDPMRVELLVPDLNDDRIQRIDVVNDVKEHDTVVVENAANGERGCAKVFAERDGAGTIRALRWRSGVASDVGDPTRIHFYRGGALVPGSTECEVESGKAPYRTIDKFSRTFQFQGQYWDEETPLVAIAEGYGLRRANPETRRFMSIAQIVLDGADPAVASRHMQKQPITYPSTGETTATHAMVVTTVGDMNVPASSGLSIGRAAGLIDYLNDDPRLGKSPNQALLDTYMAEAVHTTKRYTYDNDPSKSGVHMDVENFSQGTDIWGASVPRLSNPIRAGMFGTDGQPKKDLLGGVSAAIFPYPVPEGEHGFAFPGELSDRAIKDCQRACDRGTCPAPFTMKAECDHLYARHPNAIATPTFDVGFFMFNVLARYFTGGAKEIDFGLCNSRDDCGGGRTPVPPIRPSEQLQ